VSPPRGKGSGLEVEFERALDETRIARGSDAAKVCAITHLAVWVRQIDMVQGVERFGAELESGRLVDVEVLHQRQIGILIAEAKDGVPLTIAEGPDSLVRIGGGVEVLDYLGRPGTRGGENRVADDVRSIQSDAGVRNVLPVSDVEGEAALQLNEPGELPAGDEVLDEQLLRAAQEGNLPDCGCIEDVRPIEVGETTIEAEVVGIGHFADRSAGEQVEGFRIRIG
jgi:hypothetical protein